MEDVLCWGLAYDKRQIKLPVTDRHRFGVLHRHKIENITKVQQSGSNVFGNFPLCKKLGINARESFYARESFW